MLIIRANVWRLIDALTEANYFFSKAYSIHLHYAIHFTKMLGKVKRLFESQRLELDSKLTQPNHPTDPS